MHAVRRITAAIAVVALSMSLAACSGSSSDSDTSSPKGEAKPLKIYATTGYLADAIKNIAPDADVTTMVGPGGDPHTYQPSTKDIETIQNSDITFWNGLHLEAQMIHQLESLGDKQLAVGDKLPKDMLLDWPETDDEGNKLHDPHIWNSPKAWSLVVGYIAEKLAEKDSDNADTYKKNAKKYQEEIAAAAEEAKKLMDEIAEPRLLITGHDAFNYFGKTYSIEVRATDFVSSEANLSAEDLSRLAALIVNKKVKVIFQDNLANPQAITSLKEAVKAKGWDVKVSGEELFADSLGEGAEVDTYLEVFAHNARTIHDALATK